MPSFENPGSEYPSKATKRAVFNVVAERSAGITIADFWFREIKIPNYYENFGIIITLAEYS
jgi:hypothetical protein